MKAGQGYDWSTDDQIHGYLPAAALVRDLGLLWSGSHFDYVDSQGSLVATDPSARQEAPPALLVDSKVMAQYLRRRKLRLVWTLIGEKLVYGPDVSTLPRMLVSGAYVYRGGVPDPIFFRHPHEK